ncbi:cytochrome P450 [Sinomonas cellulolyticus]|jgi:cytochrome P450|uniref:Cytochrome P450 n=1 Tax=Sinomonas cellulolyticus TaxID=2801916 RepID=A0ABS1K996_9MICC|nr:MULTISPECIES: cytochrome P450 [Sinomonas]MBL0706886.1 cytochrome P450 [Sinomonas cellulolyticus]GHG52997.1 cytochrome P450 [Sinomonas sp. KCTC 49339]
MTVMTHREAPVLDVDPFSPENLLDRYALHETMRETGPVVYLPAYGVYAVTHFDPVREILMDFETYCSSGGVGPTDIRKEAEWRPAGILESDPPTHTAMRRGLSKVIHPGSVRELASAFAPPAQEIVARLVGAGTFDAVTDLAQVYPLRVFPDAVGIPDSGRENLLPYGAMAFNAFGPRNEIYHRAFENAEPVTAWVEWACSRGSLLPGGFGEKIWEQAELGNITPSEASLLVRALLSAGVDSTIGAIGNTILCLAREPEQWARLRREPHLAKFAVDEALRLESPFQMFHRTATVPSDVAGVHIPADSKILLFMGAANRDPRRWGDTADTFDLDRSAAGHVAFGMGLHQCVGQPIARLEMELVLKALIDRAETLELDGEPVEELHNTLHFYRSVPLKVSAAAEPGSTKE